MHIIFSLFLLLRFVKAEWELPEEFHPPKEWFERIGGYASFLRFADAPLNQLQNAIQVFLTTSFETKYSSILLSDDTQQADSNEGCLLPFSSKETCYKLLNNAEKPTPFDKVIVVDDCAFINSTYLNLNIPDSSGYCNSNGRFETRIGTNVTVLCKLPCSNASISQNLAYLRSQISSSQLCNCGRCSTVINRNISSNNFAINHLQIDIVLQPLFSATINFTDVNTISSSSHSSNNNSQNCPSIVSTSINYFSSTDNNTNIARFWLKRGRFDCPSEVTCPWEIFYVFHQDDPLFQPGYLFTAKVFILGIHIAIAEKAITYYTNKLFFW